MNFKGVVVHCGKYLKLDMQDALLNMYNNLIDLLPFTTKDCTILLETSAGQGTEVLHTYKMFSKFYALFSEKEQQKIAVCIDTCHVFAPIRFYKKFPF